jgi:hypothetical protein
MPDNPKGNRRTSLRLYLYIFLLILLFPFFFVNLPFDNLSRSGKAIFDWGHVVFFIFFVRILADSQTVHGCAWTRVIKILLFVLVIGILIEIVQSLLVHRLMSWNDVLLNLGGGIIGSAWACWANVAGRQRIMLLLIVLSVAITSTIPLGLAVLDESRARRDFPILSSFETASELSRWHAETDISRVQNPVSQGRSALRLPLTTDKYSGISLQYFPGDWRGMSGLKVSVYNPEPSGLKLTFRVHDREHAQGLQLYTDRFNRSIVMRPGWNDIFISMADVKNAPKDRKMDLGNIYGMGLFASNLKKEKVIYIDEVRLIE